MIRFCLLYSTINFSKNQVRLSHLRVKLQNFKSLPTIRFFLLIFYTFPHRKAPLFGCVSKHLNAFCYRLKAQFYNLVLIIHYNNSAYSVLKRFAATFSGNSITLFLFNFDLSVSTRPLCVFVLPMEHKPPLIQQNIQTHIDYLTVLNFVLF